MKLHLDGEALGGITASDQRALEMAIEGESAETPGSLGGGVGTEGRARRELLPVLAFAFALSPQARVVCSVNSYLDR